MRRARRITVGVGVGALALVAVGGTAYGVRLVGDSTDTALRDRAAAATPSAEPSRTAEPTGSASPSPVESEPTPTVETAPEPEPVVARGDRGEKVRELQGRLSQLAWFTPPMTGSYDRATTAAVRGFQAKRGLDATGEVDAATWRRLVRMSRMPTSDEMFNRAGPALLEAGDDGAEVRVLQARLRQIAWFFGDVSDHYGDQTVAAVRGFQAKRAIPVTGKVDRRTLDLLEGMTSDPTADELANRRPTPPTAPRSTRAAGAAACCASTRPAAACGGSWTARC